MALIGKKIGPYVVESEIGAGGMAVVYRAQQPTLERVVAIKELRGDLSKDDALIARFEREAKYVAALAHQNIVHIYDFITRGNSLYIVMEFVEGIDLFTLLSRVPRMPPDVAAVVALQTARALEYAHFRGVVHRDIKPSNLMISYQGDVKLMDFGIARDATYEDLSLTRPGIALGTPAYMSPEQILGERVDFRSDIFSFGIMLYQMLTGLKPFAEDDTRSVMNHILNHPYRRPRSVYPDVPWALQRIIKRCLQKRPAQRYGSTDALRHDLEKYVAQHVPVNYNGRLVLYLHNCHIISEDAARAYVKPSELASPQTRAVDAGMVDTRTAVVGPVAQVNVAALLCMVLWAAYVGWADLGSGLGYLQVAARPWAEIYIDGKFYYNTPVPKPIGLLPGAHRVEFRNRFLQSASREVQINTGETTKVSVDLSRGH